MWDIESKLIEKINLHYMMLLSYVFFLCCIRNLFVRNSHLRNSQVAISPTELVSHLNGMYNDQIVKR